MSETEPQNAVVHEEKAELQEEKTEVQQETTEPKVEEAETKAEPVSETKAEPEQKVDQSEADRSIADESMIVDSSVNAEKSDANAGDDEESDSDSDESLPPGLLERPVEILEAKRERKKIKRFTYDDEATSPAADKKKTVEIPKGNGIRLGSHPRVEYQLQRNTAEDLKIIHKFFYNVQGSSVTCKKNLREFCGFVMQKDTPEYEKKEEFIGKFTVDNLKWAMMVCDVPLKKGNKKEDLIDAFMEWCLCPKPQDKPVPEKKKKKEPGQKKKKKVKRSAKVMENGDATSDGATPVKKPKKKQETGEKKKKTPAKTPAKKSVPNKKAKIKITKPKSKPKVDSSADADTSDDEPLMQKRKSPPTNPEIRKFVENLLKDADLEVLTMKVVFQQVYEQYPEFDLTDKRAFIKETVKKIIS